MANKITLLILTLSLGLFISCSDSSTGTDPDPDTNDPEEPAEPAPTTGTLEVSVTTSGTGTDEDGYTVTLDDSDNRDLEINDTVTYEDLEEGTYSVELSGLDAGCTVDGDNPASVDVAAEETATAEFQVVCEQSSAEGTIVFSQRVDQSTTQLFTINADGSGLQKVGSGISGSAPAISPDGSQIAYTANNAIWVVDTDGSNAQQLTTPDEYYGDAYPAWSPDGSQIVYHSYTEINYENSDIYTMNADGTNQTQLTTHESDDDRPSWSPDGNTIIFTSDRDNDGSGEIYSIDVSSGDVSVLLEPTEDNGINLADPSWSPDGSQIAYQGYAKYGSSHIFIADADGSNAEYITSTDHSAHQPTWSPDGKYIAFMSLANATKNTTDAIWTIRTDGTAAIQLTDDDGTYSSFPSWGPAVE